MMLDNVSQTSGGMQSGAGNTPSNMYNSNGPVANNYKTSTHSRTGSFSKMLAAENLNKKIQH